MSWFGWNKEEKKSILLFEQVPPYWTTWKAL